MEVILTPENEAALRSYIHEILKQIEIAKYFGVSTATIRKWEDKGLPFGRIGDQKFCDKEKCRAWVLAQ